MTMYPLDKSDKTYDSDFGWYEFAKTVSAQFVKLCITGAVDGYEDKILLRELELFGPASETVAAERPAFVRPSRAAPRVHDYAEYDLFGRQLNRSVIRNRTAGSSGAVGVYIMRSNAAITKKIRTK
jgi:hypothetical protein